MSIWIVNSYPKAGKTTFEKFVQEIYDGPCILLSTMDRVRTIAFDLGWNGEKTPKDRKFLSDLKRILMEWQDIPFQRTLQEIRRAQHYFKEDPLIFVDCREPTEIQRFVDEVSAKTIFVSRPQVANLQQSNESDAHVGDFVYDIVISNEGSLDDLKHRAVEFVEFAT